MHTNLKATSLALALLNVSTLLHAATPIIELTVTPEIARAVIAHRLAMHPTTDFEKWQSDMWSFHALDCAAAAGISPPRELAKAPILKSGAWSLPSNTAASCAELAAGPNPVCYNLTSRQPPFTMPWGGLPSNYAFLAKPLTPGADVMVGGYCQLVMNKQHTQQFYAGYAKAKWAVQPHKQWINTAQGSVMLNFGTIEFKSSAPGHHVVLTMVR